MEKVRTSQLGRVAVLEAVGTDWMVAHHQLPAGFRRRQFCFQLHQVGHPRLLPDAACRHMMFQVHSKKPEEYETRLFDLLQTSTMAASR